MKDWSYQDSTVVFAFWVVCAMILITTRVELAPRVGRSLVRGKYGKK